MIPPHHLQAAGCALAAQQKWRGKPVTYGARFRFRYTVAPGGLIGRAKKSGPEVRIHLTSTA